MGFIVSVGCHPLNTMFKLTWKIKHVNIISSCLFTLGVRCEKPPDLLSLVRTLRSGFLPCNLQLKCSFSGIRTSPAQRSLGGYNVFHCVPERGMFPLFLRYSVSQCFTLDFQRYRTKLMLFFKHLILIHRATQLDKQKHTGLVLHVHHKHASLYIVSALIKCKQRVRVSFK